MNDIFENKKFIIITVQKYFIKYPFCISILGTTKFIDCNSVLYKNKILASFKLKLFKYYYFSIYNILMNCNIKMYSN